MKKFINQEAKTKCLEANMKNEISRLKKATDKMHRFNNIDSSSTVDKVIITETISDATKNIKLVNELLSKNINYDIDSESFIYSNRLVLHACYITKS